MEGWRQGRLGWTARDGTNHGKSKKLLQEKTNQLLTGIGLLMEGLEVWIRFVRYTSRITVFPVLVRLERLL